MYASLIDIYFTVNYVYKRKLTINAIEISHIFSNLFCKVIFKTFLKIHFLNLKCQKYGEKGRINFNPFNIYKIYNIFKNN